MIKREQTRYFEISRSTVLFTRPATRFEFLPRLFFSERLPAYAIEPKIWKRRQVTLGYPQEIKHDRETKLERLAGLMNKTVR